MLVWSNLATSPRPAHVSIPRARRPATAGRRLGRGGALAGGHHERESACGWWKRITERRSCSAKRFRSGLCGDADSLIVRIGHRSVYSDDSAVGLTGPDVYFHEKSPTRVSRVAMSDITQILSAIQDGDPHAAEQLLPLVYEELRKLAAARLARERPGQTLQATALVHEAYLRLVANPTSNAVSGEHSFANQRHFFAAAAEAMRRILVERARRQSRVRHGGVPQTTCGSRPTHRRDL